MITLLLAILSTSISHADLPKGISVGDTIFCNSTGNNSNELFQRQIKLVAIDNAGNFSAIQWTYLEGQSAASTLDKISSSRAESGKTFILAIPSPHRREKTMLELPLMIQINRNEFQTVLNIDETDMPDLNIEMKCMFSVRH